jgi:hypothetical protein
MNFDIAFYDSFRSRFEEKEPARQHLRRVTKRDLFLSVRDIVEQHRIKGYGWEGIAAIFRDLGVPISASTLRACATRAREKVTGTTPTGSKRVRHGHLSRRTPRPLRTTTLARSSPRDETPPLPSESASADRHSASDQTPATTAPGSRKEEEEAMSPQMLAPLGDDGSTREAFQAATFGDAHSEATGVAVVDGGTVVSADPSAESVHSPEPATRGLGGTFGADPSARDALDVNPAGGSAKAPTRPGRRMAFQPQRDEEL